MKNILVALVVLCLVHAVQAQHKDKWHPFSNMPDLSYFAEVNSQYLTIAEQNAFTIGVKGGLVWNPNSAAGFTFGSTVNKFLPSFETDTAVFLKNVLTGLFYEYMWKPNNKFHVTFPLAAGVGESYYDWRELDAAGSASFPYAEKYYFYIEPGLKLEANMTERVRLNAGITYIVAPGSFDYRGLTHKHVSRPTFQLGLRYGRFFR